MRCVVHNDQSNPKNEWVQNVQRYGLFYKMGWHVRYGVPYAPHIVNPFNEHALNVCAAVCRRNGHHQIRIHKAKPPHKVAM